MQVNTRCGQDYVLSTGPKLKPATGLLKPQPPPRSVMFSLGSITILIRSSSRSSVIQWSVCVLAGVCYCPTHLLDISPSSSASIHLISPFPSSKRHTTTFKSLWSAESLCATIKYNTNLYLANSGRKHMMRICVTMVTSFTPVNSVHTTKSVNKRFVTIWLQNLPWVCSPVCAALKGTGSFRTVQVVPAVR